MTAAAKLRHRPDMRRAMPPIADVQRVTAAAVRFLGGLDTIVVSAGAGGRTAIFDAEPEEFQRIIDNTLRPAFLAVRYAVANLLQAGQASVIVISSAFGLPGSRSGWPIAAPRPA